ncbi:MAG TPA: SDR family oxidoreductase [Vicinamibacterales bacterium]|nr:SDR family oxidoreductase [Vicinamibacterales bacterium]
MTDKTCIVTGANSGIGKETALGLARMGARVVLVCRNQHKGEAAVADIRREVPSAQLDLLIADMSSLASVRALAAQLEQRCPRIDVLVNNAGAALTTRAVSVDGIEMTVAGNHLGPALLTLLLLDRLKASAPSRVVNVSSEAHRSARLDLSDLQYERHKYKGINAYGQSKLLMNAFTFELARRLEGSRVTANCLHPGVVATNIWALDMPLVVKILIAAMKPFMLNAKKGAACQLHVATAPDLAQVSGQYFVKSKAVAPSALSKNPDVVRGVWQWTLKTAGVVVN